MKTAEELHRLTLKRGLRPIPKISVSEWADKHAIVPVGSAEPGRWRTSRVPYMRAVMDAFTEPNIERIVVKSASQVSKTSVILNVIGRFAHVDPASILIIQPTLEMATDFSKSRLSRFIEDVSPLTRLFHGAKSISSTRDANQTLLSKFYNGGRLVLAGANSPAGLASRPIRILLCDEVDRYPKSAGAEGDPVNLAARRTTTFFNRKIALFSTPTTEGESRIDLEYLTGTQEEWRHRCPNCGEYHRLEHKDMITSTTEARDAKGNARLIVSAARWRCPDCGTEHDELTMKRAAQRYESQNPAAKSTGIRSFFITGFSSPWITWREIMQEWIEARGKPEMEQVVYNTRFGESYHVVGAFDDEQRFYDRREAYDAEIPAAVLILTCSVDVQENRLEYEVCGWGRDEECWGIVKSEIYYPPTEPATWQELDAVLNRSWRKRDGSTLKIARCFVDSGYMATEVYRYCQPRYPTVIAIKGLGGNHKLLHKVQMLPTGLLVSLGVNEGKSVIFQRLTIEEEGAQYMHFPQDDAYLRRGYTPNYFKQLISERRVIHKTGGLFYSLWEKTSHGARNEAIDLRCYNLAALWSIIGHQSWDDLEKSTQKTRPTPRSAPTVRSKTLDIWS